MPSLKFEQRNPAAMLGFLNRVCESKVSYPSAGAALIRQHQLTSHPVQAVAESVAGCEAYRCQFCGEFHLGHSSRRSKGAVR